nr:DUF3592 domain-containing protein [Pseudobutyrivibrio xylanivorans]
MRVGNFFILILGVIVTFIGPWFLYSLHKCTEKITAKVEKVESTKSYNLISFSYMYAGREYNVHQMNVISSLKAIRYKSGEEISVYIDPKKPHHLRTSERLGVLDILILGVFSVLVGLIFIKIAIDMI